MSFVLWSSLSEYRNSKQAVYKSPLTVADLTTQILMIFFGLLVNEGSLALPTADLGSENPDKHPQRLTHWTVSDWLHSHCPPFPSSSKPSCSFLLCTSRLEGSGSGARPLSSCSEQPHVFRSIKRPQWSANLRREYRQSQAWGLCSARTPCRVGSGVWFLQLKFTI